MSSRKRSRGSGSGGRAAHQQQQAWGGGSAGGRHATSRATTVGNAELDAARQPSAASGPGETYRFYHGTSWEVAERILREGFQPSREG